MFFFFFSNKFEVRIGASPNEADIAIVSINSAGTSGELNKMVLREYGYDETILRKLNLQKGFGHYEGENKKLIIFIVTVSRIETTDFNLSHNLYNCLLHYADILSNKKIWMPLMGTGAGGIRLADSLNITEKAIERYSERLPNQNSTFLISVPNSDIGKSLFREFERLIKDNGNLNIGLNDEALLLIENSNYKFHLVGSNWTSQGDQSERFYGEGIWENGYGEEKFGNRVNIIKEGDILFNKSTYAKQDGTNYLRIKGVGIVTGNPKDSTTIYCKWVVRNIKIDIEDMSNYRDTISEPSNEGLITILSHLDTNSLKEILNHISAEKKFSPFAVTPENDSTQQNDEETKEEPISNSTKLAGLISDTDSGTDYLDITKDVNAFARVMAAKSFEPPLAIALLGKWGSGKSFFMRKLKDGIEYLSDINPEEQFCEGIAHVHFNAWSYMDANLWASFVTRIFERLDDYIKNTFPVEKEKKEIENQLFNKLNVSKEQLNSLNKQKLTIDDKIEKLLAKKNKLKNQLDRKIETIKKKTLTEILEKVDEEFKVRDEITKTLNENPTFTSTAEKFKKIVPEKYWDNPKEFYRQLNSGYAFLKAFFHRDSICKNIIWISAIIVILVLTPVFTYLINLLISWQDFTLTKEQWITITITGSAFVRGVDTFIKLKKQIAPFWKIKEDYQTKKANALFEFEQEEKGLRLEIDNFKQEILQIDSQIQLNKEIKATLEFKLKNALSTEALYTFIEKRANSDDYKKHLGIVSLIRKDFEILSGLLTGHHTELVSNKESKEFKELFENKKPLERIILYIDDLDRCPEERVVEVLEAVNLLMAFPLFVVVVGVDPRWVRIALKNKHKNQFEGSEKVETISPSDYLEKIFQLPFHLQDAGDKSIKRMIKSLAQVKPKLVESRYPELADPDINEPVIDHEDLYDPDQTILEPTENFELSLPYLTNKETIKALEISEAECLLLEDLSEIIGNNPRCVKRFINVYRIVKTHEDFSIHGNNEEELNAVMFLLAVSIGKYNHDFKELEHLVSVPAYGTYKLQNVEPNLRELIKVIKENEKIMGIKFSDFNKHIRFIKRFTFKNI